MSKRMCWEKLLSDKRIGRHSSSSKDKSEPRSEYGRDFDRIVFSTAFRRLQDKTQVFPLAKDDYIRTRLTHSLETASVGRSLGLLAGSLILSKEPSFAKDSGVSHHNFGEIVAAACLAHDIGNPPFGHAGEFAIREWFAETKKNSKIKLTKAKLNDFDFFEGNAFGFRTLCTLQKNYTDEGTRLTSAVLGTFTKYPCSSLSQKKGKENAKISEKKFGFMQSEKSLFNELANELGLLKTGREKWYRHPLAFLVEAADDICYHVIDVEDGYKTKNVSEETLKKLQGPWLLNKHREKGEKIDDPRRRAEYYRGAVINSMIFEVIDVFKEKYEEIMHGQFDDELAKHMKRTKKFEAFKDEAKKSIYSERSVIEIEASGFKVISDLLSFFWEAIQEKSIKGDRASQKTSKAIGLLKENHYSDMRTDYERLLCAVDYVASMTDSYALRLYQSIFGIAFP